MLCQNSGQVGPSMLQPNHLSSKPEDNNKKAAYISIVSITQQFYHLRQVSLSTLLHCHGKQWIISRLLGTKEKKERSLKAKTQLVSKCKASGKPGQAGIPEPCPSWQGASLLIFFEDDVMAGANLKQLLSTETPSAWKGREECQISAMSPCSSVTVF